MAGVKLHDLLKLEEINLRDLPDKGIEIILENGGGKYRSIIDLIPINENLVSKAAKLYLKGIKKSGSVKFILKKDIPAGAGLGGGSSDAAAALRLLNSKISGMTDSELFILGSKVGSDVPYCINGGFALSEGTGDIIEPINGNLNCTVLIVNNGIHVDTGEIYQSLERDYNYSVDYKSIKQKKDRFRSAIQSGEIESIKDILRNDFEKPVFSRYPELKKIKDRINNLGSDFTIMTGTGSSIVGLFRKKDDALRAGSELEKDYRHVILTKFN